MAGFGWRKNRPVVEGLFAEPQHFDFFQAVRLIESLAPQASPVGEGQRGRPEPVRFRASLAAAFPASEIDRLTLSRDAGAGPEMTVNFLGLAGAFGPLPPPFTEHIAHRTRRGDTAARDFLDIFNHRLIALFYRLRRQHRPALVRGSPDQSNFARYLFALFGHATAGMKQRLAIPDRALLHYAALLAQQPRSAHGLQRLLADYFRVPVAVVPFQGGWLALDAAEKTRLGAANSRLGVDAVVGDRVWDQQAGIRIDLGPLRAAQFRNFLPGGNAHRPLASLVRFWLDAPLDVSVRLTLKAEDVPAGRARAAGGTALGWTSWMTTRRREEEGAVTVELEMGPLN